MNVENNTDQHLKHNYDCVEMGMDFVGRWLELYTKNGLQQVHQIIYKHLAGKPACGKQCNANGNRIPVSRWCSTCNEWREMLKTFHRYQCHGFIWENQDPSKWPLSYENIVNVFVNTPGKPFESVNLQDLSNACKIWETCEFFNLKDTVLRDIKYCRKEIFAQSERQRITDNDKAKVFNTLKQLINERQVQSFINNKAECLNELDKIEKDDENTRVLAEINKLVRKVNHVVKTTRSLFYVMCSVFLVIIVLFFSDTLLGKLFYINRDLTANRFRQINRGCLSEAYTYPFEQDLPLLGYLPTQNELIGKEWALAILERKLFTENTNSRGVLMTANYGFGKSAIVAHLLCVGENMKGWNIRKHIVAFHVCKFNDDTTRRPVRFIRRLIGFLSMKSAEYGQFITLHKNSLMFKENKCEQNLYACFNQAITIPLEKLSPPDDAPWIIAIDALNECREPNGSNRVLELLSNRLIYVQQIGRKWLKWIITSEHMASLASLQTLDVVDLESGDRRHIYDIYQIIISYLPSVQNNTQLAMSFASRSGGNTLYVKLALENAIRSKNISLLNLLSTPDTIDEIYTLNFDRLFENNDNFQTAKPIFEILCTGEVLDLADIFKILKTENKVDNFTHLEKVLDKVSDYIYVSDYIVAFKDRSVHNWLRNSSKYKISVERGHAMVSNFFLNSVILETYNEQVNIIWRLADHVAKSGDKNMYQNFKTSNFTSFEKVKQRLNEYDYLRDFFLRRGALSVKSLELIFAFLNKTIHGDTSYIISKHIYNIAGDNLDIFKFLFKRFTHQEYSFLLHGAAEHCKEEMAQYLIYESKISVQMVDLQGMRPSDIACLYGCISVLKLIAGKDHSVLDMQCLNKAMLVSEKTLFTLLNSFEFNLNCSSRKYTSYLRYFSLNINDIYSSIDSYCELTENSVLHLLVRSKPDLYSQQQSNKIIYKTFVNSYPNILSCANVEGFTPALLVVVENRFDLLTEVLEEAVKDRCKKVSPVKLYIFWYFSYKMACMFFIKRPCVFERNISCPVHASFEHLLMRFERAHMIDLVIANGYTLDWDKMDIHGKTPLDYAKPDFVKQLENHFGVNIQVLSQKDKLVQLCVLDWPDFFLYSFILTAVCLVVGLHVLTYYAF